MDIKKPWVAFVCSLLVPGAGLAYLGKWLAGAVNLGVATAIVAVFLLAQPEKSLDYIHYVILLLAAGSAGLAHAWASRMNKDT